MRERFEDSSFLEKPRLAFSEAASPRSVEIGLPGGEKPLTVSELTGRIKRLLEEHFLQVFVEGEISGFRPAASGHIYFTLKDASATISCVLWGTEAARLTSVPRDGDKVEIRGRLSLYEPRGSYQIIVQSIRPAGQGRLFLAFQEMKERLQKEGLFDPERKRQIPKFPRSVGIVTSPTGAAIRDILKVLGRRAPHLPVFIYPARVQGEGAAAEVACGIERMNALGLAEVLIVGRGGGSLEDLWAFNEEVVARAIHASKIPVISAVGHEVDFTIADFVADLRAPTPSAAAEVVARNSADVLREIAHFRSRLQAVMVQRTEPLRRLPHLQTRLEGALLPRVNLLRSHVRRFETSYALKRPLEKVNRLRQQLDEQLLRLSRGLIDRKTASQSRLERLSAQLRALNPKAIMERGYSITFDVERKRVIRADSETFPGQQLKILLHEGEIEVSVNGERAFAPVASKPVRRKRAGAISTEWFGGDEPAEKQQSPKS